MSDTQEEGAAPVESPDAETLDDEPRNLLLALVSEIKIGMDLSRITLPTFILEPRSMLEKLTDFMTHGELLTAVQEKQDPLDRIVAVVKWYLSGFYIKPQGVKKPYNPILGEFFRCRWNISDNTTIHYVAEQVSHHPPISCLYFSNRKDGFIINGYLAPRSKFMGTSVASIMDGCATLVLLSHNEEYTVTFPSVYGRGILFGTLLMELVGMVTIECKQTNCKAELDFKAKPFFGGEYNTIQGKIKRGKDTLYNVSGKWDSRLDITHIKSKSTEVLWDPKAARRTPKVTPPQDKQEEFESQRLWTNVTAAIKRKDQRDATTEKTKLEDGQRATVRQRKELGQEWEPRLFRHDGERWIYKYYNDTPYDPSEGEEAESDGVIFTTAKGKEATMEEARAKEDVEDLSESLSSSYGSLKSSAGYRGSGGTSTSLSASGNVRKGSNGKK